MKSPIFIFFALCVVLLWACTYSTKQEARQLPQTSTLTNIAYSGPLKTIHLFTALCDNKWQGIVPVPAAIGNGDDVDKNLYWGAIYGVRTYFNQSTRWKLIATYAIDSVVLQRCIYKHTDSPYVLVADAYRGKNIKQCTIDFLHSCAGNLKDTLFTKAGLAGIFGNAVLVAYAGHDGLMDFSLPDDFINTGNKPKDAIVLACESKKYFNFQLKSAKVRKALLTNSLMCPEAYTLHAAFEGYIKGRLAKH